MKLAYDVVSPITKNKYVLVEDSMYLCMESGYHTYEDFLAGTEPQEWFDAQSTPYIREHKFFDPTTMLCWYKITMFSDKSILYPDVLGWNVAKLQTTNDVESKKINEDTLQTFSSFEDALNEFNKIKNYDN